MNPAHLPFPPRLFRQSLAAAYMGMTSAQFDRAVAAGEMPDPVQTSAGERYDRAALDLAVDKLNGNVPVRNWRDRIGQP